MVNYYIDIGSSTIKTYAEENGRLELRDEFSTLFKNGFTKEAGVAKENVEALLCHLKELNLPAAKTFATGIWREIPSAQAEFLTGASPYGFNVISHGEEAEYLKRAADALDFGDKAAMIINMGGKTTEIVARAGKSAEIKTLKFGVADLLDKFPEQNDEISSAKISDMESFAAEKLADTEFGPRFDFALLTGELRFEKLSGYPLRPNAQFSDPNHPYELSLADFIRGTERIFYEMTLTDLKSLMPKNPNWMTGARAGAILPLAVFKRANIGVIVPSDLNLINGVL